MAGRSVAWACSGRGTACTRRDVRGSLCTFISVFSLPIYGLEFAEGTRQQKCSKDWTDSDEYLREALRCGLKGKNAWGKHNAS